MRPHRQWFITSNFATTIIRFKSKRRLGYGSAKAFTLMYYCFMTAKRGYLTKRSTSFVFQLFMREFVHELAIFPGFELLGFGAKAIMAGYMKWFVWRNKKGQICVYCWRALFSKRRLFEIYRCLCQVLLVPANSLCPCVSFYWSLKPVVSIANFLEF